MALPTLPSTKALTRVSITNIKILQTSVDPTSRRYRLTHQHSLKEPYRTLHSYAEPNNFRGSHGTLQIEAQNDAPSNSSDSSNSSNSSLNTYLLPVSNCLHMGKRPLHISAVHGPLALRLANLTITKIIAGQPR